ncbi:hypothetical protein ACLWBD_06185 [Bdellovibrio sp. HCB117]|uniref:hypothetical protein n=1 Tax=Bdellovibrio sp. HCB117 TaxID=3394359 RepID=UPI0039B6E512
MRLNKAIAHCVCGKKNCAPNVIKPFSLYDERDVLISGKRVYDTTGRYCKKNCEYEAVTSFSCIGSACGNSAVNPETSLRIYYSLRPKSVLNSTSAGEPVLEGVVDIPLSSVRKVAFREDFCVP